MLCATFLGAGQLFKIINFSQFTALSSSDEYILFLNLACIILSMGYMLEKSVRILDLITINLQKNYRIFFDLKFHRLIEHLEIKRAG